MTTAPVFPGLHLCSRRHGSSQPFPPFSLLIFWRRIQRQIPSSLLADTRRSAREEQATPSPSSLLSEAPGSMHPVPADPADVPGLVRCLGGLELLPSFSANRPGRSRPQPELRPCRPPLAGPSARRPLPRRPHSIQPRPRRPRVASSPSSSSVLGGILLAGFPAHSTTPMSRASRTEASPLAGLTLLGLLLVPSSSSIRAGLLLVPAPYPCRPLPAEALLSPKANSTASSGASRQHHPGDPRLLRRTALVHRPHPCRPGLVGLVFVNHGLVPA